jgi:hypothetical protein
MAGQGMKAERANALFQAIFARDGGRCVYCGIAVRPRAKGLHRAPDLATLDHVRPRSQGGGTVADNLVLACHACNNARGVMDAAAFRILRGGVGFAAASDTGGAVEEPELDPEKVQAFRIGSCGSSES